MAGAVLTRSCDVLIVTFNSARTIDSCVQKLEQVVRREKVRLLVWDNTSTDGTPEMLDRLERSGAITQAFHSPSNLGFPAACNELLARSDADVVCFLNPDVEIAGDVLLRLVAEVSAPDVGAATVRLQTRDGRPQPEAARPRPTPWWVFATLSGLGRGRQRFVPQESYDVDRDVECAMGALIVARRAVVDRVDGFDTSVFMYLEDLDFCRRIRDAGLRIRYLGSSSATHISGASRAGFERRLDVLGPLVWVTYFARYGSRRERFLARPIVAMTYLLRASIELLRIHPRDARMALANAVRACTAQPPRRRGFVATRYRDRA
jgi:GT2 family glycosyltransferase